MPSWTLGKRTAGQGRFPGRRGSDVAIAAQHEGHLLQQGSVDSDGFQREVAVVPQSQDALNGTFGHGGHAAEERGEEQSISARNFNFTPI